VTNIRGKAPLGCVTYVEFTRAHRALRNAGYPPEWWSRAGSLRLLQYRKYNHPILVKA